MTKCQKCNQEFDEVKKSVPVIINGKLYTKMILVCEGCFKQYQRFGFV